MQCLATSSVARCTHHEFMNEGEGRIKAPVAEVVSTSSRLTLCEGLVVPLTLSSAVFPPAQAFQWALIRRPIDRQVTWKGLSHYVIDKHLHVVPTQSVNRRYVDDRWLSTLVVCRARWLLRVGKMSPVLRGGNGVIGTLGGHLDLHSLLLASRL